MGRSNKEMGVLGTGLLDKARNAMQGRKSRVDSYLDDVEKPRKKKKKNVKK